MATSKMIDIASRDWKPGVSATMHHEAEAVLYRPRMDADFEAQERAKASRSVLRMALGRHDCPRLAPCDEHGQEPCDCRPCHHPNHADDTALAGEALLAFGLAEQERPTHWTCSTCHRVKAVSRFAKTNQTCKECLSKKKAAREAGVA